MDITIARHNHGALLLCLVVALLAAGCSRHTEEGPRESAPEHAQKALLENISPDRALRISGIVHERVNGLRKEHWLRALSWDNQLAEVALEYSEDMAARGFFSHMDPEGGLPQDRVEAAGHSCEIRAGAMSYGAGENLGKTSVYESYSYDIETGEPLEYVMRSDEELAAHIVSAWMESPAHRDNILMDIWRSEGVGIFITPQGIAFVTQVFC